MSEMNFPSNSQKSKAAAQPAKKQVKKVIQGEAIQRKKPLGRRIVETFTGDDMNSVGQYILFEVLLPAAKTMISDAASQGVERLLFGDSRPTRTPTSSGYKPGYTSYNSISSRVGRRDEPPRSLSRQARSTHDFGEFLLRDRVEAETVLDGMMAILEQYDVVTVSDFYSLVGISGEFTDEKWGWTDLRDARIHRAGSQGFALQLPPTAPID